MSDAKIKYRQEVMQILTEECAEVIQALSKISRFGIESTWNGMTNRESLTMELGDALAMMQILISETDLNISDDDIDAAITAKLVRVRKYLPPRE